MIGPMTYSPITGEAANAGAVVVTPQPPGVEAAGPSGGNTRRPGRPVPSLSPDPDGMDGRGARLPASAGDESRLLALLADKTRLRILRILSDGERPVVALTAELRLPQPTVSHHLAWLRMMNLVAPRRQGKHVFYSLGTAAECDEQGTLTLRADNAIVRITPHSKA